MLTNYAPIGQQLSAIWGERPLLLVSEGEGFEAAVDALAAADVDAFLYLRRPPSGVDLGRVGAARCTLAEQYRGQRAPFVLDLDFQSCRVGAR